MKKQNAIGILAALLSFATLTACAEGGNRVASETVVLPSANVLAESADKTDAPDYSDISALFSTICDDAAVSFNEKETRLEVIIQCVNLSSDAPPENWETIVSSFTTALVDGKSAAEQYGFTQLSGQLEAKDGSILISGYGGDIKFDLFSQDSSSSGATSITLGPGTYTVGKDITAGTYDCNAVSGFGVLRGDVAALGDPGFVQTMGSVSASVGGDSVSVGGSSSYSNLTLTDGDVIYIEMSLNVEFVPK